MKKAIQTDGERYIRKRLFQKRWHKVLMVLSSVVVFCTTYALILPAITLEKGCRIPEHTHSDPCYTQLVSISSTYPICTAETLDIHRHEESCFDGAGNMVCGHADFVVHQHDPACYDEDGSLWCPLPEVEAHRHDDPCYEKLESHTHGEDCYAQERGELICELHEHTDACWTETATLICDLDEAAGHEHTEECLDEGGELVCGEEESEGHQHSGACYEVSKDLTCGSDSGHAHSDDCYVLANVLICGKEEMSEEELPDPELICDAEEVVLHRHTEQCCDEAGCLICGKLQILQHQHSDVCFATEEISVDTEALTCTIPEGADAHTHGEDCYGEDGILLCVLEEGPGHQHGQRCYGVWELTCGLEEHIHGPACRIEENEQEQELIYTCGKTEHFHDETCLDENGELMCELEEHTHDETCTQEEVRYYCGQTDHTHDETCLLEMLTPDLQEQVEAVIAQIDALPTNEELSAQLDELTEEADKDAVYTWYMEGYGQYLTVRVAYDALTIRLRLEVTNAEKLLSLRELWEGIGSTITYANASDSGPLAGENDIFTIDAVNVFDFNANVILLSGDYFHDKDGNATRHDKAIGVGNSYNLEAMYSIEVNGKSGASVDTDALDHKLADYYQVRIEYRQGRLQAVQSGVVPAENHPRYTAVQAASSYILLIRKSHMSAHGMYEPNADWPEPHADSTVDGAGDSVTLQMAAGSVTTKTAANGTALGYVTLYSRKYDAAEGNGGSAGAKDDDICTVSSSAIRFQLFDYSENINLTSSSAWRTLSEYFNFRGVYQYQDKIRAINNTYDEDGFTNNHATVERTLDSDGYPVLDLSRTADGMTRSDYPALDVSTRSLAYLFGGTSDHAVSPYSPSNTILQYVNGHYIYNSAANAVDYDSNANVFRVRNYVERNGCTASSYNAAGRYYDFLPFNYTDGVVTGTATDKGGVEQTYNLLATQVDYWFGMKMDVDFYQPRDGVIDGQDMTFQFAGDDDVWVFIDGVLVLDLGGTHGEATGSINFKTGEIKQYLSWLGRNSYSRPTTLRACFDAAGVTPNGGWSEDGQTFADYSGHTLVFFYMERGQAVANCSLDFNLYTLPQKALTVAKELTADPDTNNAALEYWKDTVEYQFRVLKADGTTVLIPEGTQYTLQGDGAETSGAAGTVGADGFFTLKAGQRATFSNVMGFFESGDSKQYIVQEYFNGELRGQYADVAITSNGIAGSYENEVTGDGFAGVNSPVLDADSGSLVSYENKIDTEKLSKLLISKTVSGAAPLEARTYTFNVKLGGVDLPVGTTYTIGDVPHTVQTAGTIPLKAGETAEIKLLAGTTYQVTEVIPEGADYAAGYLVNGVASESAAGTVTEVGSTIRIVVDNQYASAPVILKKLVSNTDSGETDGSFTFQLEFELPEGVTERTVPVQHSGNSALTALRFVRDGAAGTATVSLKHEETLTLSGLPVGLNVIITELGHDGYTVSWDTDGRSSNTESVTVAVDAETAVNVVCTNTTGYVLPETGGHGTQLYTTGGVLLMAAALCLLYLRNRRRKEGRA